jgi:hypothetical protein
MSVFGGSRCTVSSCFSLQLAPLARLSPSSTTSCSQSTAKRARLRSISTDISPSCLSTGQKLHVTVPSRVTAEKKSSPAKLPWESCRVPRELEKRVRSWIRFQFLEESVGSKVSEIASFSESSQHPTPCELLSGLWMLGRSLLSLIVPILLVSLPRH